MMLRAFCLISLNSNSKDVAFNLPVGISVQYDLQANALVKALISGVRSE